MNRLTTQIGASMRRGRRLLIAGSVTALVLFASVSSGQSAGDGNFPDDDGYIIISDARLTPVEGGWQLDARAEIRLSPVMRAGLDNGVPLEFAIDVALKQRRQWWFDRTVFAFEWRYTLAYYELTRHYRLQTGPVRMTQGEPPVLRGGRADDGEQGSSRNFRSLLTALDQMGTMRGIELPAANVQKAARKPAGRSQGARAFERLDGELEIRLDDRALPLPLQPVFSSTWRLASEEFVWPLN